MIPAGSFASFFVLTSRDPFKRTQVAALHYTPRARQCDAVALASLRALVTALIQPPQPYGWACGPPSASLAAALTSYPALLSALTSQPTAATFSRDNGSIWGLLTSGYPSWLSIGSLLPPLPVLSTTIDKCNPCHRSWRVLQSIGRCSACRTSRPRALIDLPACSGISPLPACHAVAFKSTFAIPRCLTPAFPALQ